MRSSSSTRATARRRAASARRAATCSCSGDAAELSEVAELLQELIRVDTTNPPGNETAAAELLRDYLEAAGVECELYARVPERANLVARIRGTRRRAVARAPLAHRRRARRRRASGSAIPFGGELATTRSGAAARST